MMNISTHKRSLVLLSFILTTFFSFAVGRHLNDVAKSRHKRQQGENLYLSGSYTVPGGEGGSGWSDWGSPSPCSRSCGGGVTTQIRTCDYLSYDGTPLCEGGSKKHYSCNTQDCPDGSKDFRSEQCAEHNDKEIEGVRYDWVPYTKGNNPCELNCMPKGERFYYQHDSKVVDGTLCNDESSDVCVDGQCLPVGCDLMLGSDAKEDKCRQCRGDSSTCNTVTGLYDNDDLVVGYNDILLIPEGATHIVIKEQQPSNNYFAIRNKEGEYYLNGNWKIDFPRPFTFAGCIWHYERTPQGFTVPDSLTCVGPTSEAVYLALLYQGRNVGIKYEYSLPTNIAQITNEDYVWVHDAFSPCSATCGGGIQRRNVTCTSRQELRQVDDNLCDSGLRPIDNQTCANIPCPAQWSEGEWDECSAACGDGGTQSRQIYCFKIVSHGTPSVVADDECFSTMGPKPPAHQKCNVGSPCPTWHVGPWNPCDKLCGEGKQRRSVRCYRKVDGKIEVLDDQHCSETKPDTGKECILHPCEGVDWIISEWSGCDSCTSKVKTRTAFCATVKGDIFPSSFCSNHPEPVIQEDCDPSSLPKCDAQWYASDWSKCSGKCGEGVQSRRVFCGVFDGESLEKVPDEKCDEKKKYTDTKPCEHDGKDCPAEWHSGPWSECSEKCGGGEQTRKVLCLRENKTVPITECEEDSILDSSQSCNKQACTDDEVIPVEAGSTQPDDYDDEEWCDEDEEDDEDIDFDFDATTPFDKSGSTSMSFEDLMQSDSTYDPEDSTDRTDFTEGSGDDFSTSETTYAPDETGSGSTEFTIEETTEGTIDMSSTLASTDSSSPESSSESSSTESSSSDSSSTDSSSKDTSSTDSSSPESSSESSSTDSSSTDSSSKDTSSTDSSSSESSSSESSSTDSSSIDSSSKDTSSTDSSSPESSSSESSSTDSSSIDTSSTDSSSTDSSNTDSSSTDSSSTDSSSTDSSSTDSSSTDSSSTDSSSTDSSSTDSSSTDSSSTDSSSTDSSSTDSSSTDSSSTESSSSDSSSSESTIDTSTIKGVTKEEVKGEFNPGDDDDDDDDGTVKPSTDSVTGSESTESTSDISTEESSTVDVSSTIESSTDSSSPSTEIGSTTDDSTTVDSTTDGSTTDGSTTDDSTTDDSTTDDSTTDVSTTEYSTSDYSTSDQSSTEYSTSDYSTSDQSTSDYSTSSEFSTIESSTSDYSTSDYSSTEQSSLVTDIFGITKPKCKKRPKKPTCLKSKFGCCSDNKTAAEGPFEKGCPTPETCKDTKHGCCPDGVSPSSGPKNKGCPVVPCKETLFGCCDDNKTPSEGNNKEGCPPPPPACLKSKYGCCADNETEATGPAKKGCPETITTTEPTSESADCEKGEFGCCDDGKTPASGPDKRGCCSITEHGCCPDGESPASGPNKEGCEEGCSNGIFGCCRDNKTPAHGPLGEGCCLMEQFGCCPDNILAARGPDNEGCGCQWTPYGCCPDNVTTAKGHDSEGCPCEQRPNGCCPDKHTPASGPNFEGCPCHTHQFGCCPDGKRAAKGPREQGCDCSQSEFGCCSDEATAATGPNQEGCDCSSSKYGCCPDGVTEAKNAEFEGCEDIPKNLQESCSLEKDRGPCNNYTVNWFYDMEYGGCSRFWYGGCEGNDNNFRSQDDCKDICVEPQGKDACQLPKVKGPCEGYYPLWYYDAQHKQCVQFVYGGCLGNNNRFQTREDCQKLCEKPAPKDQCTLLAEQGTCKGNFERWAYNSETLRCEPFTWGGCGGNTNRFESESACKQRCDSPGKMKAPQIDTRIEEPDQHVDRTDPCEVYKEECDRLRCPYGEARSVLADGCEKCSCANPCENIICEAETLCSIELQTDENTGEVLYTPVCRSASKPGECPEINYESYDRNQRCETECYTDADCSERSKCCNIGCSKTCIQPQLPRAYTAAPAFTVNPLAVRPPTFDDNQEPNIESPEGQVATFNCIVHGNPPPVITWEKDSVTIDGTKNRYVILSNGVLQIVSVYRNDTGTYVCVADNGAGQPIRKEFNLEVKDPENHRANVISFGENVIGTLGAPLVLRCLAYGWPAPMVKWWRGKTMLPLNSEQYEMRRDNSLLIRSLQISKLGEYICDAYNGLGAPGTWSVKVQTLRPINVPEAEEAEYGQYLVTAYSPTVIVTPRPHVVTEPPVVEEPVYEPPTYNVPVTVNLTAEQTSIREGNDLMLHCSVDGYPIPFTYWYKDNEPLQENPRVQISESNRVFIQRANRSDAGEYRCEAVNSFSQAYSSVTINIETGGAYIPANCTDNQYFANCSLIVRAQYCNHRFYGKFCCRSCMEAGLLSLQDYERMIGQ